jgi:hypothetical protein
MARRRPTEAVANPARGAALVVVAVLVGLFLLRNGLDTSAVVTSTDGGNTTAGATDSTDTTVATSVTVALRPPAQVPTIVLNGSGVSGAAKRYSALLASKGYTLTNPDGGNATANVPTTKILYADGFDREAAAVAAALGAPTVVPAPIGTEQPGTIAGAQVVVVLGPDLGSVNPTAGTTTTAAAN